MQALSHAVIQLAVLLQMQKMGLPTVGGRVGFKHNCKRIVISCSLLSSTVMPCMGVDTGNSWNSRCLLCVQELLSVVNLSSTRGFVSHFEV